MSRAERTKRIKELAAHHGFDRVGVAPPGPFPEARALFAWLQRGYHGDMGYLAREPERRADPRVLKPWVRSLVVLAADYHTAEPLSVEVPTDPERGWISRYAWGDDYHDVLERRLRAFTTHAQSEPELAGHYHYYVDHGPVLERLVGSYGGLGWIGKNTMLIHPRQGSYFFLAVVFTDLELDADDRIADHCGTCRRCLDACPTQAFVEPYILDATRCISYLTIESRQPIPPQHQEAVGFHVFGCDVCQDVCPYNRWASPTADPAFQPREGLVHPKLAEVRQDTPEAFSQRFRKSPVKRRKYLGFQENIKSASTRRSIENMPGAERIRAKLRPPKTPRHPSAAPPKK